MLVFVYGTLQTGRRLHRHLAGQKLVGKARTAPRYRMYRIDWFPGLVDAMTDTGGIEVHGEVWDVDEKTLAVLDEVEDVESGLYERKLIQLQSPFDNDDVIAYFYLGDTDGCSDCGDRW